MIYENIRNLCLRENISIARLEREAGLSNGTVCRWKLCDPTVGKLKRVADRFGVTVDDLLQAKPITISVQ